jgi:hypothetical protein
VEATVLPGGVGGVPALGMALILICDGVGWRMRANDVSLRTEGWSVEIQNVREIEKAVICPAGVSIRYSSRLPFRERRISGALMKFLQCRLLGMCGGISTFDEIRFSKAIHIPRLGRSSLRTAQAMLYPTSRF